MKNIYNNNSVHTKTTYVLSQQRERSKKNKTEYFRVRIGFFEKIFLFFIYIFMEKMLLEYKYNIVSDFMLGCYLWMGKCAWWRYRYKGGVCIYKNIFILFTTFCININIADLSAYKTSLFVVSFFLFLGSAIAYYIFVDETDAHDCNNLIFFLGCSVNNLNKVIKMVPSYYLFFFCLYNKTYLKLAQCL